MTLTRLLSRLRMHFDRCASALLSPMHESPCDRSLQCAPLEPRILMSASPAAAVAADIPDAADPSDTADVGLPDAATAIVLESDRLPDVADNQTFPSSDSQASPSLELVLVDTSVPDYQQLVSDIVTHSDERRGFEVFLFDSDRDGIAQITSLLSSYRDVDAVHIVSHGTEGRVQLGNAWLTSDSIRLYAGELAAWSDSLTTDADVLIYGCDLAGSEDGQELLRSLSALSGADVAASDDLTGHSSLGGDWEFEYLIGSLDTELAFSTNVQQDWLGLLNAVPAGQEIQINATDAGTEEIGPEAPKAVASSATGDFVVVWQGQNSGLDVSARRFDKDGNAIDIADIAVNDPSEPLFGSDDQFQPTVAMNESGAFVVVWTSQNEDGDRFGVYAQAFTSAGARVTTAPVRVNAATAKDQFQPAVAMRNDGSFVVTWTSDRQDADRYGVYLRRFDAASVAIDDADIRVNAYGLKDQQWSSVDTGSGDDFVVTWTSADQDGDQNGVYAQRFNFSAADASGIRVGSEFRVNVDNVNAQQRSDVAVHTDGSFVITWESDDQTANQWQIRARRYDTDGTADGGEIHVSTNITKDQTDPAVTFDAGGNFLISWSDNLDDLRVRQFDSSGTPRSGEILVNNYISGNQARPGVAALTDGNFVAVWSGQGDDDLAHDNDGVLAQRFSVPALPGIDPDSDNSVVAGSTWAATFTEGGAAVPVTDTDPQISDTNNTNVHSVAVRITNALNGPAEWLTWTDHASVTETWNAATHSLTLTGGTISQYEAVLASVRYQNISDAPSLDTRTIRVYAKDETTLLDGPSAWATISINAINDVPVVTASASASTDEDTPLIFESPANPITIADDSLDSPVEVTLTAADGIVTVSNFLGTEQRVNVTTPKDQHQPVVAVAADGRYVVVWTHDGSAGLTGDDIYARTYNADGTAHSGEILVAVDNNDEHSPAVAIDDSGNFVVVWEDDSENLNNKFEIEARTFDFDGVAYSNAKRINRERLNEQLAPTVGFDAFGNFIVAWQSKDELGSGDGDKEGIFYRRWTLGLDAIDSDDVLVNTTTDKEQKAPAIAVRASGEFVIVWQSEAQDGDKEGIYGQRFHADGTVRGSEFLVNAETNDEQSAPAIAVNSGGEFVVAWQSRNQDDTDGKTGVYARKFDFNSNGVLPVALTGELPVNTETDDDQTAPTVTIGDDGRFAVAWQSKAQDNADQKNGIYLQQFDTDGTRLQNEIRVNTETTDDQTAPSVSMKGDSPMVVVWQSRGQDSADGNVGVYSQRFLRPGALEFSLGDGIEDASITFRGNVSDINRALNGLIYAPNPDFNGATTLQIDVDDLGHTGTGGQQVGSHTVNLTINAVNDAPEIVVPGLQLVPESQTFVFQTIDANQITIDDVDAGGGLLEVRLDVGLGALHIDTAGTGVALVGGTTNDTSDIHFQGTLSQINDALDGLTWQAPGIFTTFTLTVEVDDLGHAPGPNRVSSATVDLDVFDFNIPPVNVYPNSAVTPENTPIVFSGANAIQVIDDDAGADDEIVVTLIATHGIINIPGVEPAGLDITNNGTSHVVIDGKKNDVNAMLDGMRYTPDTNYAGPATLQIISNDKGNNGIDGDKIDLDFIPIITVNPDGTNNTPTFIGPTSGTTTEETAVAFSSVDATRISLNDDAGGNDIRVTIDSSDGTVSLSKTAGQQFQVNIATSSDQQNSSVAMNPNGDYVVVWQSNGQDGDGQGIYAQRYSAAGLPLDAEFKVNATEHKNQTDPVVAMDDSGRFVIAWTTEDQDAGGKSVYAQGYAADGARIGGEFQVNSYQHHDQRAPAIAMDAGGRFVIVWESDDQDGNDFGIFGQLFEFDTVPFDRITTIGSEFQVNVATHDDQLAADVAMDEDGDFVVAWQSKTGVGKWDIRARRFDAAGVAKDAGELAVNSVMDEEQRAPVTAMDRSGNFVVVWESKDLDYSDNKFGIYQRRFLADGTPATGQQDLVNTKVIEEQLAPAIAMSRDGDYAISWQSKKQDHTDDKFGVFAQRFAADGSFRGSEFQVNSTTVKDQLSPATAMGDHGRFVVVWSSDDEDTSGWGVFGQRFRDTAGLTFLSGDGADDGNMSFEGTIDEINDALDGLSFLPEVDFDVDRNGPATFTISVDDLGWSVGGGQGVPQFAMHTVSVVVNPVNDAPTFNLPATQTAYERVPLTFSAFHQNSIVVNDADAMGDDLEITLTAWGGQLTLSGTANLTFTDGDGQNDDAMTFTGTLTDINAALGGLTYTPPAGFSGAGNIQIFASDLGNNGVGGTALNYGFVDISVEHDAVNDAPDIIVPGPQRTDEDVPLRLGDFNSNRIIISDDAGDDPIRVTLTATDGWMTLSPGSGPELRVNTELPERQWYADIAAAPTGEAVVVWQSEGQDGDNAGIYGQRFSSVGHKVGPEFQINQHVNDAQEDAAVAMNASGEFVVTWTSNGQDSGGLGIYARKYAADGTPLTDEFLVNSSTINNQENSDVAIDDSGRFVVVWQGEGAGGTGDDIWFQRFDTNGVASGSETRANDDPVSNQIDPSVGMDTTGNFVIAWQGIDANGKGIQAQRYDANGNPLGGGNFAVNTIENRGDEILPSVSVNSAGRFAIVWESNQNDEIRASYFDNDGSLIRADFVVKDAVASVPSAPTIALSDNHQFVVGWESVDVDGTGLWAQRFDSSGNPLELEFAVNTSTVSDQTGPAAAIDGSGNPIFTFTSDNGGLDREDVYVQRFFRTELLTFHTGTGVADTFIDLEGPAELINAALNNMVFTPGSRFNGLATIGLTVDDQGSTGTGGPRNAADTVVILVAGGPFVDLDADDSSGADGDRFLTHFTVGSPPISVVDVDAEINDTGANEIKEMLITLTNRPDGGLETLSGTGTINITVQAYDSGSGVLRLVGNASRAEYMSVLQTVIYDNAAGTPGEADRLISITFKDKDNNWSNTAETTILIDRYPPEITLNGGILFTEGDPASLIITSATVVDPDTASFDGGTLTIDMASSGTPDDYLSIRNQGSGIGQISTSGNDILYNFSGVPVVIGSFLSTPTVDGLTPMAISLSANSDATSVAALMENVLFRNTSNDPATHLRAVRFVLDDNDGGVSETASVIVRVDAVMNGNTAPNVSLSNSVNPLAENTDTTSSVRVADIVITDDGIGTNNLSLSGTDASDFLIIGSELHVKAGTILDYEAKASYDVRVNVDDPLLGTGIDDFADFALSLSDVNDLPPVVDPLQSFVVSENAANLTSLGIVTVSDPDTVGTLTNWTITGGNTAGIFAINSTTGELTVADNSSLDYESATGYTLSIRVEDGVNTSVSEIVTVSVNDVAEGLIVVDTTSDVVDGDTTSIATLAASRGTDGRISLREAIIAANNTTNLGAADEIRFNIPDSDPGHLYYQQNFAAGLPVTPTVTGLSDGLITDFDSDHPYTPHSWFRIDLDHAAPGLFITDAVIINGYSQSGAVQNSLTTGQNAAVRIELTSSGADGNRGLTFDTGADGSVVRGLAVNGFDASGIMVEYDVDNVVIQGNFIGTDITGTVDIGNGDSGVQLRGNSALVGGTGIASRNIISGSNARGIALFTTGSITSNVIQNNYIGTDATGLNPLGNAGTAGIQLYGGDGTQVLNNVIADNALRGIHFRSGSTNVNTVIQGNLIGLSADGSTVLGNGGPGIEIAGITENNTIGGTGIGEENVISGNSGHGILMTGIGVTGNTVVGNLIGTDASGLLNRGNLGSGIHVEAAAAIQVIGGTAADEGNVIAFNANAGVSVTQAGTNRVSIRGNSIHTNGTVGIDLRDDGIVQPNDPGDTDSGANNRQNFPVLTTAAISGLDLTVAGTLNSTPFTSFVIDFYASSVADASGHGEAERYIGSATGLSTDASGNLTFSHLLSMANVVDGEFITAAATDSPGNTSEFALSTVATLSNSSPTGTVTISGLPTEDQILTASNTLADADGLGVITYQWQRDGADISGATGSLYMLADADVGTLISVRADYTDGGGTSESVTSPAIGPVGNVNDSPGGAVSIVGSPSLGAVLTASHTLSDEDGLGAIGYQWKRSGLNIPGANETTYILPPSDVGAMISVEAAYVDGHGTAESVQSSAVGPVTASNSLPTGSVTISGTLAEDQTLTAANSLADADGLGPISYQWKRNGVNIAGATSHLFALGDADVAAMISVAASYTDGGGTNESVASSAVGPIANVNDAPAGTVTVSGVPAEDQTLTAANTLTDNDGLGIISYQWRRNGIIVSGATGNTYLLGDADSGQTIQVTASFTDGQGTAESVTSTPVGPIVSVNDPATGLVTISGTATEDQILTASHTLADPDGMGLLTYRWQRNGVDIAGGTGAAYALGDADVGSSISVVASYTDGQGTLENVSSSSLGPVANINDLPGGAVSISGSPSEGSLLTGLQTLTDSDGMGLISYQWKRNGVSIVGASSMTYTLSPADVGTLISLEAFYTDGYGMVESVTSTPVGPVTNVNNPPTGNVTISGTVTEDQILSMADTLADADGLGAISYQWKRNGVSIPGATGRTYTLGDSDVGTLITVEARYTDGGGTNEVVLSSAAGPVININDAPTITAIGDQVIPEEGATGALSFSVNDIETPAGFLTVSTASTDPLRISADHMILTNLGGGNWTLSVAGAPDAFGGPVTITVTVNDGDLSVSESFDVVISAVNDAPVLTAPSSQNVSEDTNPGTLLFSVGGMDADPGDTLSYAIISGDPNGTFSIAANGGVSLTTSLDAAVRRDYVLTIQVRDNGAPALSDTATIAVTINQVIAPAPRTETTDDGHNGDDSVNSETPIPDAIVESAADSESPPDAHSFPSITDSRTSRPTISDQIIEDLQGMVPEIPEESAPFLFDATVQVNLKEMKKTEVMQRPADILAVNTFTPVTPFPGVVTYEATALDRDLQEMRSRLSQASEFQYFTAAAAVGATSSLTVGYVLWAIRGGWLASSILAQMPAWRLIDPLVVLSSLNGTDRFEDDESLQDILEKGLEQAPAVAPNPESDS